MVLLVTLALLLVCGALFPAAAEFPRITASMNYGIGGLFDEEYVSTVKRASEVGRFSSGVYGVDVSFVFPSYVVIGVRARSLRVPLGNGTEVGRFDILPAVFYVGYRRPALAGRIHGFVGAGMGLASARFSPAETIGHWQAWEGEEKIDVSDESPLVVEVLAGMDIAISEDFSIELAFASTFMDTEVAYRPVPVSGFAAEEAYRVEGRHLALSLGLRWWVELW